MTEQDPIASVRRALAAVRDADRPVGVDREAMLARLLADVKRAPTAKPSPTRAWVVAGLGVVALLVGVASRAGSPARKYGAAAVQAPTNGAHARRMESPHLVRASPEAAPHLSAGEPAIPAPASVQQAPEAPRVPATLPTTAHRAPDAEDEWQILRRADAALRTHEPAQALEILAEHAQRHPRSVATPEVMAYRVRALCMLGRDGEARSVAGALVARAPDSPAAYSLRATCVRQP